MKKLLLFLFAVLLLSSCGKNPPYEEPRFSVDLDSSSARFSNIHELAEYIKTNGYMEIQPYTKNNVQYSEMFQRYETATKLMQTVGYLWSVHSSEYDLTTKVSWNVSYSSIEAAKGSFTDQSGRKNSLSVRLCCCQPDLHWKPTQADLELNDFPMIYYYMEEFYRQKNKADIWDQNLDFVDDKMIFVPDFSASPSDFVFHIYYMPDEAYYVDIRLDHGGRISEEAFPPSMGLSCIRITFIPFLAADTAVHTPAMPPPTTHRSVVCSRCFIVLPFLI